MPVDVSMYPSPPQPSNPLATFGQLAGLQGQLQQNQIRARTMAATQAQGEADAQATSADGTYDPRASLATMAQDPRGVYGMHQATADAQAMQQAQLAQHVQQVDLRMKQLGYMTQQLGSMANTPDVTGKQVADMTAGFINDGIVDPKIAATELSQMPTDEKQIPQYLQGLQKRSMDSQQQLGLYYHNLMVNTGSQTVAVNDAPLNTPAPVQMDLSPGQSAQPVTGPVNPDGSPTTTTLGQFAGMAHNGPVQTGLSPSAAAAGQVTGASNAQRAQDLSKAAATVPDTKALLGNMSGDLHSFTGGKGAAQWKDFLSGINRIFPGAIDPNGVASQENFNKAQTLLAQRSFGALGGTGTDAKLESAIHSNPNEAVSQLGNEGIIALNKGFADALALKNNLWQKALQKGQTPDSYGQFENSFNQKYDPRVFQFQYLGKKDQDQALSGMTSAEKGQFYTKLHYAEQKHWVGSGN